MSPASISEWLHMFSLSVRCATVCVRAGLNYAGQKRYAYSFYQNARHLFTVKHGLQSIRHQRHSHTRDTTHTQTYPDNIHPLWLLYTSAHIRKRAPNQTIKPPPPPLPHPKKIVSMAMKMIMALQREHYIQLMYDFHPSHLHIVMENKRWKMDRS